MPLNILHVDTEKTWRGGERQALWLIKLLPRHEFTSIVAAPAKGAFFHRVSGLDCTVVPFTMLGEWDILAAWRLSRMVKKYAVSIIHAHSSHALGIAACARKFCRVKLVASRRVDYHVRSNMFSKWKYKQADRIVAISDAVREVLIGDGVSPDRIDVVKSGIEFTHSAPVEKSVRREEMGIPPGNHVVGIVGALTSQKDHDTFVESARLVKEQIPNTTFLIIGEGERRKEIEMLIDRRGLARDVIMAGFRNDVMELIEFMDVYVVSSAFEGMGTSTLDAMYRGKPVVATNVGGVPEIVEDGETGFLVSQGDYAAMAEKIIFLLRNTEQARTMGEAARLKVREFSVEKTAQKTAEVYRKLLKL